MDTEDIRQWLDNIQGDYVVSTEASKFCAAQKIKDPNAFALWLESYAPFTVANVMGEIIRSDRSANRSMTQRMKAGKAVDRHLAGDLNALPGWLAMDYEVSKEHVRRHLRDMSRNDLIFVAEKYRTTEKTVRFEAEFFEAIAKNIPNGKTVKDVYSEQQLIDMRLSI